MFIVLLGAPGSGKGTVGKILAEKLETPHISTGDLFRKHLKEGTELGKQAEEYMNRGELVPDEITIQMLYEEIKGKMEAGAIFDGFPRTENQAQELEKMLLKENKKVDIAINIEVPFEEIIERIADRRSCTKCSAIYNVLYNPPKEENKCDECGATLYQREDQKPEVVNNRLEVYKKTSAKLIDYYKNKNVLYSVEAGDRVNKTSYDVAEELKEYLKQF